jgi:hypothetical protein
LTNKVYNIYHLGNERNIKPENVGRGKNAKGQGEKE